jgi:hypothetical protein
VFRTMSGNRRGLGWTGLSGPRIPTFSRSRPMILMRWTAPLQRQQNFSSWLIADILEDVPERPLRPRIPTSKMECQLFR